MSKRKPFKPVTYCKNSGRGSIKCNKRMREKYQKICITCHAHNPDLVDWKNLSKNIPSRRIAR